MASAELFIHIGAHKSGTTALQYAFNEQRKKLQAHGVLYPEVNWFHFAQHRLALALKGRFAPGGERKPLSIDDEIAQLKAAIAQATVPRVFISSEEYFSCPAAQVKYLAQALDGLRCQIVATVRRPDGLLLSSYNQKAKRPGDRFHKSLASVVEAPRTISDDMAQFACISNWCEAFGRQNVTLLRYEDGDTISSVMNVLGLPAKVVTNRKASNSSVPGIVIEIMRLAKEKGVDVEDQKRLFHHCTKRFKGQPGLYLSTADRKRIVGEFESENDRLFSMFGMENTYRAELVPAVEEQPSGQERSAPAVDELLGKLLKEVGAS